MAIYSFRMQVIGRSAGRSATAAAAYRSGEEIKDERTGQSHDYTGKSDIYDSEILKPENAPERYADRQTLWNEVEQREKRKDSQLCNEVMVALPAELTHEQKQQLIREYVRGEFTGQGMVADIGYHDFDSHNPHAHIMLTMRSVDKDGFGKKQREWNRRDAVKDHRAHWAEYANRALERAGHDARIDHRSLKEQGVEREPQIHLGAQVMEMEAKGIRTRVGDESRRISKVNRDIARRQKARDKVQAELKDEQRQENMRSLTQPTPEQQSSTEQTQTQKSQEKTQQKSQQRDPQIEQQLQRNQAQQRQQQRQRKKQKDQGYGY
ncbi:MobA/MobL family [Synechococcus sp. PCC 7335]|nr:MobA/MobL family [Synechococcus sp. PCC 7335]